MPSLPIAPLGQNPFGDDLPKTTSGLAIASLVLGCLGFCSFGLTSIPAIICGHISHSQIGKSGSRLAGGGMAITGLVLGYATVLLLVISIISILAGVALPVFSEVKERGMLTKALSDAKQVGTACLIYELDFEGNYPERLEELTPEYLHDAELLNCSYPDPKSPTKYIYIRPSKDDPGNKIILASPKVPNKGRVYVQKDGSGFARSRLQLKKEGDPLD